MPLHLKGHYCMISLAHHTIQQEIICIGGSHKCPKPENQGHFDYSCIIEIEDMREKV